MSRILLIKCRNLTRSNFGITPPMGVMYIASVLRKSNHSVIIYDSKCDKGIDKLRQTIEEFKPEIVGLSAITNESEQMH